MRGSKGIRSVRECVQRLVNNKEPFYGRCYAAMCVLCCYADLHNRYVNKLLLVNGDG